MSLVIKQLRSLDKLDRLGNIEALGKKAKGQIWAKAKLVMSDLGEISSSALFSHCEYFLTLRPVRI